MAKQSKWLKWKIGGGLIVSLAVVFQMAKADPAFGKAVQAAQGNDDSVGSDEDAQGDLPQTQVQEETTEEQGHKDQVSQDSVETVLSPGVTPTLKVAEAHSAAPAPAKKTVTAQKQPSKNSILKAVANSKPTPSQVQKPSASVESPAVQQSPPDIPVAAPAETVVAPVENNNQTEVQTEESSPAQEEAKPNKKKKSHSKSHHS